MTEELYWRAQWAILELEEGRAADMIDATGEDILDILLALS